MKSNEEVETQKHSGISLTLQDDWEIIFRSFDIGKLRHFTPRVTRRGLCLSHWVFPSNDYRKQPIGDIFAAN